MVSWLDVGNGIINRRFVVRACHLKRRGDRKINHASLLGDRLRLYLDISVFVKHTSPVSHSEHLAGLMGGENTEKRCLYHSPASPLFLSLYFICFTISLFFCCFGDVF